MLILFVTLTVVLAFRALPYVAAFLAAGLRR